MLESWFFQLQCIPESFVVMWKEQGRYKEDVLCFIAQSARTTFDSCLKLYITT